MDLPARAQTLTKDVSPDHLPLSCELERSAGWVVLVNASFNVDGELIVSSPK